MSREFHLVSEDGEGSTAQARAIDLASEEKPFLEMGYTIGRMLEDANQAAEDLKRNAEQQAAVLLQEAGRNSSRTKEEAERITRQARSEATVILDEARSSAARLMEQAQHDRRLAEAEATVIRREAQREGKLLKGKAQREAQAIIDESSAGAADRVRELEHRLRSLQRVEADLERRVAQLRAVQRSLGSQDAEEPEPEPEPS
jgi:cell division septum initiation protein DivIVA